jgi:hypothetical protein
MDPTLSLNEPDLQRDAKFAPLPPENLTNAEELLAKLAQEAAAATTNRPAGTAEADFSAGPRLGAPSRDIASRPLGSEQATGELTSRGRRAMPSPFRFLLAACIGVVATLAWQSYGAAGRRLVATFIPQLGLSSSPNMTQPLPGAVNKDPAGAAVEANAADGAPAQVAALAQTRSDPVVTPAPASAEVIQRIEALAHDITAMRQSMEQLTAAQSQMARTIAALQAAEDARRELPASPPRPTAARKPTGPPPQRAPQPLAPGPRPLSQSVATSPPPAPAPAPIPAQPPRPPGSMP